MNISNETKTRLCLHLQALLESRMEDAKHSIAMAKESRDGDTKSSAGDKYETGREMMQLEMDKNELQLSKAMALKKDLSGVNTQKTCTKVEFGSLVRSQEACYFVSIGLGKVVLDAEAYYAISLASPLGMALKGRCAGEKVLFQGKEIAILEIC